MYPRDRTDDYALIRNSTSMKTILQWLNELPPGYRERALRNASDVDKSRPCNYMSVAIDCFVWDTTPEGEDFWGSIFDEYECYGSDPDSFPPLPDDGHGGPSLEPETNKLFTP